MFCRNPSDVFGGFRARRGPSVEHDDVTTGFGCVGIRTSNAVGVAVGLLDHPLEAALRVRILSGLPPTEQETAAPLADLGIRRVSCWIDEVSIPLPLLADGDGVPADDL